MCLHCVIVCDAIGSIEGEQWEAAALLANECQVLRGAGQFERERAAIVRE